MTELSVLTLNIWGLWLVSKKREERVKFIAEYLQTCTEDVVLLQEVWVDADAQTLIRAGKAAGLIHCTHFRSGIFGAGLVTLSRHPILRHQFWRYAAAGFASSISCGDYYAGKGVGWVRLVTPLGEVDVFNTHLHANYCHYYRDPTPALAKSAAAAAAALTGDSVAAAAAGDGSSDYNRGGPAWHGSRVADDDDAGTRIAQLLELSELINIITGDSSSSSSSGRHVILGGDLNCKPDTLEVDLLRLRLPQLSDAWVSAAHSNSSSSSSSSNDDEQQQQQGEKGDLQNPEGYTCHAPGNTYQPKRQVPERIDYIWSNMACSTATVTLQVSPAGLSYSDHFAVRATLLPPASAAVAAAFPGARAMKLGPAAAAAGATKPSKQQQQIQGSGEGGAMPVTKQVATALAAAMLLEEGMQSFTGSSYTLSALGGFMLTSVVYAAFAVPMLLPDVIFKGLWKVAGLMLGTAVVAVLGIVCLLMGQVADKSQKRALQNAYRLLKVWMQQTGLEPGPSASEAAT